MDTQVKDRIKQAYNYVVFAYEFSTQQEVSDLIGVARPNLSRALNGDEKYLTNNFLQKFLKAFGTTICDTWLLTGEGEMLVKDSSGNSLSSLPHQKVEITDKHDSTSQVDAAEIVRVPLIPFEARGGQLNGFANNGVTLAQCETVPTPFKGAQFAISVRGQSMSPTYPSGCVLFISKNIADWVEWGKVYVLDTENGVIVKQLAPSTRGNDFVCCKSFNDAPEFAPFDVPKSTIFGIYRVVGALIET